MPRFRKGLPQLGGRPFIIDGGIESAAFDLFRRVGGEIALRRYYDHYVRSAREHGAGLVLESATWRASADWGDRLGYTRLELSVANRKAIRLLEDIRDSHGDLVAVISGCIGPRADGYRPTHVMKAGEAQRYHRAQVDTFSGTKADMVTAISMNDPEEAIGVALAAQEAGLPAAISFTVETDGRLPTGQPLRDAIEQVDDATDDYPAYYLLGCARPEHSLAVLERGDPWTRRINRHLRCVPSAGAPMPAA